MSTAPVTLLFTDLVDSTALLQRVGAEGAQRVLHAHRQLLHEALASHGGREVKWLGDGLLTTFESVAEGVRCAVTMASCCISASISWRACSSRPRSWQRSASASSARRSPTAAGRRPSPWRRAS
jgi:hypothetical protein